MTSLSEVFKLIHQHVTSPQLVRLHDRVPPGTPATTWTLPECKPWGDE